MTGNNFQWSSEDRANKPDKRRKRPPPVPEGPREVTLQDLGRLPLRATVAFAARCARRVQPTFHPPEDFPHRQQALDVVDGAIRLAEEFAAASSATFEQATHTSRLAFQLGEATCDLRLFAPYAAYHAARAVAQAASAGERASEDLATEVLAAAYGACRVVLTSGTGARPDADTLRTVCAALCADFDALCDLESGTFRELGQPVNPSEKGPLGPLWPEGAPPGF